MSSEIGIKLLVIKQQLSENEKKKSDYYNGKIDYGYDYNSIISKLKIEEYKRLTMLYNNYINYIDSIISLLTSLLNILINMSSILLKFLNPIQEAKTIIEYNKNVMLFNNVIKTGTYNGKRLIYNVGDIILINNNLYKFYIIDNNTVNIIDYNISLSGSDEILVLAEYTNYNENDNNVNSIKMSVLNKVAVIDTIKKTIQNTNQSVQNNITSLENILSIKNNNILGELVRTINALSTQEMEYTKQLN